MIGPVGPSPLTTNIKYGFILRFFTKIKTNNFFKKIYHIMMNYKKYIVI